MSNERGPSPEEMNQAELAEIDARLDQLDQELIAAGDDMLKQIRITQESSRLLSKRNALLGGKPEAPRGHT